MANAAVCRKSYPCGWSVCWPWGIYFTAHTQSSVKGVVLINYTWICWFERFKQCWSFESIQSCLCIQSVDGTVNTSFNLNWELIRINLFLIRLLAFLLFETCWHLTLKLPFPYMFFHFFNNTPGTLFSLWKISSYKISLGSFLISWASVVKAVRYKCPQIWIKPMFGLIISPCLELIKARLSN